MKCPNCGNEITAGQRFCVNCGAPVPQQTDAVKEEPMAEASAEKIKESTAENHPVESEQAPDAKKADTQTKPGEGQKADAPVTGVAAVYSTAKSSDAIIASIPKDYKPLSIGQFFGYEVLFGLPIVGVIASLIFALEASKNVNLINFARARFLWTVVETILTLIAFFVLMMRLL